VRAWRGRHVPLAAAAAPLPGRRRRPVAVSSVRERPRAPRPPGPSQEILQARWRHWQPSGTWARRLCHRGGGTWPA
jgi:hypothetical protein